MPVHGTVIALDPDIPPQSQRLRLQAADHASPAWHGAWTASPGPGAVLEWLPWPGRHTLELVDAQGLVLDTVRFEVRGAGWRRGPSPAPPRSPDEAGDPSVISPDAVVAITTMVRNSMHSLFYMPIPRAFHATAALKSTATSP